MANHAPPTELQIEPNGSVTLPESLREALGVAPGDRLLAHVERGQLILERREEAERRLLARFANVPKGVSLADELIRERRAEARREATS